MARTKRGQLQQHHRRQRCDALGVLFADDPRFLVLSFLRALLGVIFPSTTTEGEHYRPMTCLNSASVVLHTLTQRVVVTLPALGLNQGVLLGLVYNPTNLSRAEVFLRYFMTSFQSARLLWGSYDILFKAGETVKIKQLPQVVPFCLDVYFRRMMLPMLSIGGADFLDAVRSVFAGSLFLESRYSLKVLVHHLHEPQLLHANLELSFDTETHAVSQPLKVRLVAAPLAYCRSVWYSLGCGCEPILYITHRRVYLHHESLLHHLPALYRDLHVEGVRGLTYVQITMDLGDDCDLPAGRLQEMVAVAIRLIHQLCELQFAPVTSIPTFGNPFFRRTIDWLGLADFIHAPRMRYPQFLADASAGEVQTHSELQQLTLALHTITVFMLLRKSLGVLRGLNQISLQAISFVVLNSPERGRHTVQILRNSMLDADPAVNPCFFSNINFYHVVPASMTRWEQIKIRPDHLARWLCDISHLTVSFVGTILEESGLVLDLLQAKRILVWEDLFIAGNPGLSAFEVLIGDTVENLRRNTGLAKFTCLSVVMLQLLRRDGLSELLTPM